MYKVKGRNRNKFASNIEPTGIVENTLLTRLGGKTDLLAFRLFLALLVEK